MFPVTSSVFADVNQLSTMSVVMSSIDQEIGPLYPYVCPCVCVCMCVYVYVCVCVCVCVAIYNEWVCIFVSVHVCV